MYPETFDDLFLNVKNQKIICPLPSVWDEIWDFLLKKLSGFMAWGDKIDQFNIKQGETVEVSVDLESREYNGRWYTDVKAWKVSRDGATSESSHSYDGQDYTDQQRPNIDSLDNDVIPF